MPFPYYERSRTDKADPPVRLERHLLSEIDTWQGYRADVALEAAVNVALLLGQPLLLTGEPGTGKTQLAFHLSNQLGWSDPLVFEAKSTSTYRDLFYTYDALGRFHARDIEGKTQDAKDYIEYNALGRAILRTRKLQEIARYLREPGKHDGPRSSVVLIDEIDKAPRDFPNDILREIENLYFKVPEIDLEDIKADSEFRPVVIVTSNSEKTLPPAFVRRCTFFHIEPPSRAKLVEILENRVGRMLDGFYSGVVDFYERLKNAGLQRQPGTAELIAWVAYLQRMGVEKPNDSRRADVLKTGLSILVKDEEDMVKARTTLEGWLV